MNDCYEFHSGDAPLLISVPHDGRKLPADIAALMTASGKLLPDTDWHVARLYNFATELGASMIVANYSRYVVDLNRPADDTELYEGQRSTGLCPRKTFDGRDLYTYDVAIDMDERVKRYWRPYHDKIQETLNSMHAAHGRALLWDAHSIASRIPALFDGELPVLNVGSYDGQSCPEAFSVAVMQVASDSPYGAVLDARFKGGYITRRYGNPDAGVYAIQLELAQRAYMDEETATYDSIKASQLRDTLRAMLVAFTMRA